jgi:putative tricarboxylic transport membrane protein
VSDRLTGLITILVALAFFASATQLEAPFFADPLGPKAFPFLISSVALIAGLVMFLRPDEEPDWPVLSTIIRLVLATVILVFYAYSLKPLGFLFSTAVASAAISYQIKAQAARSVITGICLSAGLFIIFKYALGLSLFAFPRWFLG